MATPEPERQYKPSPAGGEERLVVLNEMSGIWSDAVVQTGVVHGGLHIHPPGARTRRARQMPPARSAYRILTPFATILSLIVVLFATASDGPRGPTELSSPTSTESLATSGIVLAGHASQAIDVAFSPNGRTLATTSYDRTVRLWDVASHDQIGQPFTGHTDEVRGVAFSPDGHTLATTSIDRTVRLWDVASHDQIGRPFTGHTDNFWGVAFSPDGHTLAATSDDGTARLWDIKRR